MLRLSAILLAASVSGAQAQLAKESYSEAECEYIVKISDDALFPTICKHTHLQPVMAEITNMRYGLEGDFYNVQTFKKFLDDVEACNLDQKCADPVFFDYHAYLVKETEAQNAAMAAILAARRASCPDETYKKGRAACYIVTAAEYSCSQAVAVKTGANFTGSAAICAGAIQTLKNREIDILSFGFSIAAGIAEDIAQSSFDEGTISGDVNAALAKLASLGFVAWGLQSCLRQVDYQCGR